jgi:predicted MFS family arabinose efflux permease
MFAMFLYLTLYIQTLLGFSPFQTGLRFLPVTVVSFFVAAATGNLGSRIPMRFLLGAGLMLVGVGELLMRGLTPTSHWTHLLAGFILAGAGIGLVNPTLASVSIGVVPPERSGMASGINNTFRQVGTATGIAALGAIFESVITHHLTRNLVGTPLASKSGSLAHAVAAGGTQRVLRAAPPPVRPQLSHAIAVSFTSAMNDILLVGGVIAIVGAVLAVALVRARDFATYGAAQPMAAAAG